MSWVTIDLRPEKQEVHVIPNPDIAGHRLRVKCWCKPHVESCKDGKVVVHPDHHAQVAETIPCLRLDICTNCGMGSFGYYTRGNQDEAPPCDECGHKCFHAGPPSSTFS